MSITDLGFAMAEAGSVPELLRRFLEIQGRRATIYSTLHTGFAEYLNSRSELAYKELCNRVTSDFNDCSRQVIEIASALRAPSCNREDLAFLLQSVQSHEKIKLQMTATLQILKRAGHPNERAVVEQMQIKCADHSTCSLDDVSGLEECQAEAEYQAAHKEATTALQDAVLAINDLMETVRYEIEG